MNKVELVARVASESDMTKAETDRVLDRFIAFITISLQMGEEVSLPGFGKFVVVNRAPRAGRNPRTGEAVTIEAKRAVKFLTSSNLKSLVNG
jgi:DNA-binding protein HU-beta